MFAMKFKIIHFIEPRKMKILRCSFYGWSDVSLIFVEASIEIPKGSLLLLLLFDSTNSLRVE